MINVLITSGTSAFSQRVAKMLPNCRHFFADSSAIPAPLLNTGKYKSIPNAEKNTYVHEVLKVCLDLAIDMLIPLGKDEILPLANSEMLFTEYGVTLLLPPVELLEDFSIVVNPSRSDYPEVFINAKDDQHYPSKGVFVMDETKGLLLCCVR